ncbi:DUF3085 domain-containing protein [Shinella sp.]|uniref:DUF3085 domain-containing protein n=1 Tax=Shinella sp. TaxID=1870904 RepID=UPI002587AE2A|nr:DUF3085 domain-containing protein [Shinella sp.]MCW5706927.1 DUF3085 domain-containing protein [Shinella sp.]
MLRFKNADLRPIIAEAVTNGCTVALVKNHGVCMLSSIGESLPDGRRKTMAYAIGCNPDVDAFDDWQHLACSALGIDDCIQRLDVQDDVFQRILNSDDDLEISATETHLSIEAVPPG